jgi:transcriptional regulator with PAS, ATPase and Fis domain
MAVAETIDVQDLPEYLRNPFRQTAETHAEMAQPDESFESHEKRLLAEALERAGGNQSQAARELRIGRDALRYKMRKHGLL